MISYRVTWEVDVDADSPREAAIAALLMQDAHTTANVFTVTEVCSSPPCRVTHMAPHESQRIDLGDEPRHFLLEELVASDEIELDEDGER